MKLKQLVEGFFTVYSTWRRDRTMFLFTNALLNNRPIKIFNEGKLSRDFTYIDDIVNGMVATLEKDSGQPFSLYNIGNSTPVKMLDFIDAIEVETGMNFNCGILPMQPGDVEKAWADTGALEKYFNYKPSTKIQEGVKNLLIGINYIVRNKILFQPVFNYFCILCLNILNNLKQFY